MTYRLDKKGVRVDTGSSYQGTAFKSNSHAAGVNPAQLGRPFIRLVKVYILRYFLVLLRRRAQGSYED